MLNLILADLKVLGHRIWAVPLGVFLFIFSFSFIPYLDQVYKFQNWIFAILIPGLLTFELFREEQKNRTDSMLMTMPVSKEKYVWSKYLIIIFFSIFAVLAGALSNYIISVIKNIDIPNTGLLSYGFNNVNSAVWALKFILFIIPIYYFTKKLKLSLLIALVILYFFLDGYFSLYYRIFYTSFITYSFSAFLTRTVLSVLIFLISIILVKIIFQKAKRDFLNTVLFAGILYLSIVVFQLLAEHMSLYDLYLRYTTYLTRTDLTEKQIGHVKYLILSYKQFTITLLGLFILLVVIMILIRKKTDNKFWQTCAIYSFTPVFIMIFEQYIFDFLRDIFPEVVTHNPDITSYPLFRIPLMMGLTIAMFISARASIYLLKNDRRLS
ncbi:MAG TPA: ABC-2 transporter permease [Clostridiales bacterium]|nr:ABC-2 transporter permease [Clostridiales bacterium]